MSLTGELLAIFLLKYINHATEASQQQYRAERADNNTLIPQMITLKPRKTK